MKKHRVGLLAFTLASIAAFGAANAADMYRAPEPFAGGGYKDVPVASWTGFYAGVNGGGAFDGNSGEIKEFRASGSLRDRYKAIELSGGFGGGQIGYNWQGVWHPHLVLGVEVDIQGADISDHYRAPALLSRVVGNLDANVDWFGTVRGRIGYAFDSSLLYATGGLAYGSVKIKYNDGIDNIGRDDTQTGYVVGAGFEHKFSPRWSAKVEYQYINLGDEKLTGNIISNGAPLHTNDITTDFHTVRAGLNYHIAPAYEPLK
jgi:outer membrane immunogenic protein